MLKVLRQANIVKTYRDGTLFFHELARQELIDLIKSFKKFAKDNIKVRNEKKWYGN